MKNFLKKCKEKWFKKMSYKEYNSGMVAKTILPEYKIEDFNLETKAANLYFLIYSLHTNFFKCGKNMPLVYIDDNNNLVEDYVDLSEYINKPHLGWSKLGSPYMQKEYQMNECYDDDELKLLEEEWIDAYNNVDLDDWNEKLMRCIVLQEEYKELMRLIYKTSYKKVKIITSNFNYEDDVNAHASFGGRWRHDRKDKINKKKNHSHRKKG